MIGGIVGVGVFGIPYAFSQSGFVIGALWLFVLGILLVVMQLMFTEVILQTEGEHRIIGYIRVWMGERWARCALGGLLFSSWGALIAYLIVGGGFAHRLLSPALGGTQTMYAVFLALLAGGLMYRGVKTTSRIETPVVCLLLFLFLFVIVRSLPEAEFANLLTLHAKNAFVPYGVLLFSMGGIGILPEMRAVLGGKKAHLLPQAVIVAKTLIIFLYFAFAAAVVAVSGRGTTEVAFDGLVPALGVAFGGVVFTLGTITIFSIFMVMSMEMMNALRVDYRVPHPLAWLLAMAVPLGLYLAGVRDFIEVISLVGAIFTGTLGVLLVATYERMRRRSPHAVLHCLRVPRIVSCIIMLIFVVGMISEIYFSFS